MILKAVIEVVVKLTKARHCGLDPQSHFCF